MSDSYITNDGLRIWTSEHLLKKGACCRSSCLHCPYGHTVKTIGLNISDYDDSYLEEMNQILEAQGHKKSQNIALRLLEEINEQKEQIELFSMDKGLIRIIKLKDFFCGFIFLSNGKVDQLFLKSEFQFQGITKSVVREFLS